ncbi:exported protein of unknown function [Methylocella tundrae]|uniref:Uncharacterized protein n=1 Tax=Methylocella tundrae TaxID=227605 RepID=A0A4U8YZN4_METTU|nr:exported protein of unknown function [Methylocella tundrae]
MGYIRGVSLFAAVLTAGACCEATISSASQKVQSAARSRHDGVYAVDVFTHQGACDSVYHWTITVLRGRVSSPADGFMQASGEITPRGVVSLWRSGAIIKSLLSPAKLKARSQRAYGRRRRCNAPDPGARCGKDRRRWVSAPTPILRRFFRQEADCFGGVRMLF